MSQTAVLNGKKCNQMVAMLPMRHTALLSDLDHKHHKNCIKNWPQNYFKGKKYNFPWKIPNIVYEGGGGVAPNSAT